MQCPIMQIDEFIRTLVGADLSRPPPIYRPRWIFRYPDYLVNMHHCARPESRRIATGNSSVS